MITCNSATDDYHLNYFRLICQGRAEKDEEIKIEFKKKVFDNISRIESMGTI